MRRNIRKERAVKLRKGGYSIRAVEKKLKIPRSTLSGWFHSVELTRLQKEKLLKNWRDALIKARAKAVVWHNTQKRKRLEEASRQSNEVMRSLNFNDKNLVDLALAMLYLGEGFKKTQATGMGNTDPLILKIFVTVLRKNYGVSDNQLKCQLHLRADQNQRELKNYWSKELNLPLRCFNFVYIDKRTLGSKTYPDYKGVCMVRYNNVAIQRKLINLGRSFCEKIISLGV